MPFLNHCVQVTSASGTYLNVICIADLSQDGVFCGCELPENDVTNYVQFENLKIS